MKVLEKILEEITIEQNIYENDYAWNYSKGLEYAKEIIRSHMDEVRDSWIPIKWRYTTAEDGIDQEKYPIFLDCKMPDDGQDILISAKDGSVCVDTCYNEDGYCLDSGIDWIDVIAWMPFPEPYKPDEGSDSSA